MDARRTTTVTCLFCGRQIEEASGWSCSNTTVSGIVACARARAVRARARPVGPRALPRPRSSEYANGLVRSPSFACEGPLRVWGLGTKRHGTAASEGSSTAPPTRKRAFLRRAVKIELRTGRRKCRSCLADRGPPRASIPTAPLPLTVAAQADVAKALGDLIRLQLLDALRRRAGKVCVCELVPLFDVSEPTLSHPPQKAQGRRRRELRAAGSVGLLLRQT